MFLKRLSNIPHKNKNLVYGYIRSEYEEVESKNVPIALQSLSILYLADNEDSFDARNEIKKGINISKNTTEFKCQEYHANVVQ